MLLTVPAGVANVFDQVKADVREKPCEYRRLTFTCMELYQLEPTAAPKTVMLPFTCGYGRSACSTVAVVGKVG